MIFPERNEVPNLAAPAPMGFQTMATFHPETRTRTSLHMVPLDDVLHEADPTGRCVCGPYRADIDEVPFFQHWPVRESYYGSPWGEDGPLALPAY